MTGMKNIKHIKKYLIPSLCLLASTCLGDKTVDIQAATSYTDINIALSSLSNNEKLKLTITSDPNMEKTWYTLNTAGTKNGIKLELIAKDSALNKENLEYLTECLWSLGKDNVTLTKLDISNNNIISGNALAEYLSCCSDLTEIIISKNKNSFCSILLDKLVSKKITRIEASECGLKARSLEKILDLNTTITNLDLSKNNMDSLTDKFAAGLQKNAIATLNLSANTELFKNPRSAVQILKGINGKSATVTLTGTNYSTFTQAWLNGQKGRNTLTFN